MGRGCYALGGKSGVVVVFAAPTQPRRIKPVPGKPALINTGTHTSAVAAKATAMAIGAAPHRFGAATGLFLGGQARGR